MPRSTHSDHCRAPGHRRRRQVGTDHLVEAYLTAYEWIVDAGFGSEIDWQDDQHFENVNESDFLREAAWVILSAGMRETVVRDRFLGVTTAFLGWSSAQAIVRNSEQCVRAGLSVFNHQGKIRAIGDVASYLDMSGFDAFRHRISIDGVHELQQLPYIGPVTRYHLAKNIGLDVVKPDRHLVRMAFAAGFSEPDTMCRRIADVTGDRLATVDVVLWRFATICPSYRDLFDADLINARNDLPIVSLAA